MKQHALCKLICVFSCVPAATALGSPPIRYQFELRPGDDGKPAVRVHLLTAGSDSTSSRFCVQPHWGGVDHSERFIHALSAASGEKTLTIRPADDRPSAWIVEHQPNVPLEITYELRPGDKDWLAEAGNHYEPIVRDDLFHMIGENGLLTPEWLDEDTEQDIRIEWQGFAERGWKTTTSFDAVAPGQPIRATLGKFRHALFLAGKLRLHDRDIKGRTLRISIFGDDWGFDDERLVDLAAKVVTIERDFFDDHTEPFYLVSLIPAGKRHPGSWSFGGTGLTHSFACFMQPGPTLQPGDESTAMVARLLAHEYFHNWNGAKIDFGPPEQLAYWFSEGFTDFYAPRLLHRAGVIDDAQWVRWLNENLTAYWTNPARREKNSVIIDKFWTSRDIGVLPYRRGEAVALLLDWEIRRRTDGAKNLDHLMRELVSECVEKREKQTTDSLLTRFARWTSDDFAARLRKIIVDGEMPEFPADFHARALVQETVDKFTFDLGFDSDASVRNKEIAGVRDGSAAHRAGLRNGQKLAGVSIYGGNADRPAEITIKDGDGTKKIEFLPRGDGVRTPQFTRIAELKF